MLILSKPFVFICGLIGLALMAGTGALLLYNVQVGDYALAAVNAVCLVIQAAFVGLQVQLFLFRRP